MSTLTLLAEREWLHVIHWDFKLFVLFVLFGVRDKIMLQNEFDY